MQKEQKNTSFNLAWLISMVRKWLQSFTVIAYIRDTLRRLIGNNRSTPSNATPAIPSTETAISSTSVTTSQSNILPASSQTLNSTFNVSNPAQNYSNVPSPSGSFTSTSMSSSSSISSSANIVKRKIDLPNAPKLINSATTTAQLTALQERLLQGDFQNDLSLLRLFEIRYQQLKLTKTPAYKKLYDQSMAVVAEGRKHNAVLQALVPINTKGNAQQFIDYCIKHELIEKFPSNGIFPLYLGQAYRVLNQNQQAITYINLAIERFEQQEEIGILKDEDKFKKINLYIVLSQLYKAEKEYETAVRCAEKFISLAGQLPTKTDSDKEALKETLEVAYLDGAEAYKSLGKLKKAQRFYKQASYQNPSSPEALIGIAEIFYHENSLEHAFKSIRDALKIPSAKSNLSLADLLYTIGVKNGEPTLLELSKKSSKNNASLFAGIYAAIDFDKCLNHEDKPLTPEIARLLKISEPKDIVTQCVDLYAKLRNTGLEEASEKERIKTLADDALKTQNPQAITLVIYTYYLTRQHKELVNYIDKVKKYLNLSLTIYALQSMSYNILGQYDKSLEIDELCLSLDPDPINLHAHLFNIAFDCLFTGHYQRAFAICVEILTKSEQSNLHHEVFAILYESYLKLTNIDEAINIGEQYLKNHNIYNKYCSKMLAAAYLSKMNYSQASKYYQTILDHNDSDLVAIINLGNIFLYQGEKDQATECFKKLFRINPKIFEQDPELAKHLQEQGIWDKVITPLSVSSTEESEPLSPTKPKEIGAPAQEEQISRISSSRMQDSATTIQGEELTILPSSPSPSSSRSQSSVVQAATPKPLPMKNVAAFTSSAVSEILKRRSSKAEMTDINKQKIHNFILGSLRNEGHNLAEKLLKELPKLGLGRSYIKELQPAIKESRERKEGKEKAESKQQLNINNITLGQRDVYEFTSSNKSKIIIKFDREKIAEALTSKFAGNAVKIMEKIDVELQKKQLAAPHNKSGIKIISDEEVELKIYGTQGIGDIRITGKVESFSYQNTEGCRFAVLNVLTTHKGIEREK